MIDGTSGDVNTQIRFPSNLSYIVNLVPGVITPYYGSWPSIAHLDLIFSNLNEESHAIAKVLKIKLELSTQDTKLSSVHGSQIDEEKYTFSLLGPEVHYGNQNVSILADTGIRWLIYFLLFICIRNINQATIRFQFRYSCSTFKLCFKF